jgi:hypothetical protein
MVLPHQTFTLDTRRQPEEVEAAGFRGLSEQATDANRYATDSATTHGWLKRADGLKRQCLRDIFANKVEKNEFPT